MLFFPIEALNNSIGAFMGFKQNKKYKNLFDENFKGYITGVANNNT